MVSSPYGTVNYLGRLPLIAGNWKMNKDHEQAAAFLKKLSIVLQERKHRQTDTEIAIFPPFTDIPTVQKVVYGKGIKVVYGAQDLSSADHGAYTGDISGEFLNKLGCTYVLVGHSERRTIHGESDAVVNAKVQAAYRHGLLPVICVGEGLEVRQAGKQIEHTLEQVRLALGQISETDAERLVIAYEPVWAIGTGETATTADAQNMAVAIREEVAGLYNENVAQRLRILYGGSVNKGNSAGILYEKDVDGVLVGGASLDAEEFDYIARCS